MANVQRVIPFLVILLMVSVMNATMFNIALPTIADEFQLRSSEVSWVVTSYIIIYAIGSVTYGKLADLFPIKRLLFIGLLVFTAGSTIGFFATSFPLIVVGRIAQSLGASVIPAFAMFFPTRYFSVAERGKVMGIVASSLAFGTAIGPILAGTVTTHFGWRYLFLLSGVSLLLLPGLLAYLPTETRKRGTFDWLGAFLLAGAISTVVIFVTLGQWFVAALCLFFTTSFIWRIRTAAAPFLQPALFRIKPYRTGLLTAFFFSAMSFSSMLLIPLLLQQVNGLRPDSAGFFMFPGALAAAAFGFIAGQLTTKIGNVRLLISAYCVVALAFLFLSSTIGAAPFILLGSFIAINLAMTSVQTAMANYVSASLPKEQAGIGMGAYSLTNFLSGAIGSAVATRCLDLSFTTSLNPLFTNDEGAMFSNLFLAMSFIVIAVTIFFIRQNRHYRN